MAIPHGIMYLVLYLLTFYSIKKTSASIVFFSISFFHRFKNHTWALYLNLFPHLNYRFSWVLLRTRGTSLNIQILLWRESPRWTTAKTRSFHLWIHTKGAQAIEFTRFLFKQLRYSVKSTLVWLTLRRFLTTPWWPFRLIANIFLVLFISRVVRFVAIANKKSEHVNVRTNIRPI